MFGVNIRVPSCEQKDTKYDSSSYSGEVHHILLGAWQGHMTCLLHFHIFVSKICCRFPKCGWSVLCFSLCHHGVLVGGYASHFCDAKLMEFYPFLDTTLYNKVKDCARQLAIAKEKRTCRVQIRDKTAKQAIKCEPSLLSKLSTFLCSHFIRTVSTASRTWCYGSDWLPVTRGEHPKKHRRMGYTGIDEWEYGKHLVDDTADHMYRGIRFRPFNRRDLIRT